MNILRTYVKYFVILIFILVNGLFSPVLSEEMVYRPVNPAFGGHPLNGAYLLQNAGVQNGFDPPDKSKSPIEKFSETVQAAILNQVARQISDSILGEDARDSGRFTLGDLDVRFERQGDEVLIEVTEPGKAGTTEIRVPAPVL